jgi:hypothetical protein
MPVFLGTGLYLVSLFFLAFIGSPLVLSVTECRLIRSILTIGWTQCLRVCYIERVSSQPPGTTLKSLHTGSYVALFTQGSKLLRRSSWLLLMYLTLVYLVLVMLHLKAHPARGFVMAGL